MVFYNELVMGQRKMTIQCQHPTDPLRNSYNVKLRVYTLIFKNISISLVDREIGKKGWSGRFFLFRVAIISVHVTKARDVTYYMTILQCSNTILGAFPDATDHYRTQ